MSIIHTAYIAVCNSCGKILRDAGGNIRSFSYNVGAIQAAREEGWAVNLPGDKDYCPECRKKIENENDKT